MNFLDFFLSSSVPRCDFDDVFNLFNGRGVIGVPNDILAIPNTCV